jgi:hypothetical protein
LSCDNFVDPKATRRVPLLMAFLLSQKCFWNQIEPVFAVNIAEVTREESYIGTEIKNNKLKSRHI